MGSRRRAREGLGAPPPSTKWALPIRHDFWRNVAIPPSAVNAFLSSGAAANVLQRAQFAIPPIASGIQRLVAYFDLLGKPYYPPNSSRVCAWGSLFNPGRTFVQYVAHLSKACQPHRRFYRVARFLCSGGLSWAQKGAIPQLQIRQLYISPRRYSVSVTWNSRI